MISRDTVLPRPAPGPKTPPQHPAESGPVGGASALARRLTHAEINAAIETGAATSPLYRQDVLWFEGRWWELARGGGGGWLEVTGEAKITAHDRVTAGMSPERAEAQRAANIRAVAEGWR